MAIAIPWAWYLVRDLGPAMQFVSMALPVLVAASLLGLLIAAADARKVTPLLVAASVAAFGWVSVIGPRGAQPSPKPVDPVRIAAVTLPETGVGGQAVLKALAAPKADVEVVVAPTKKAGAALARSSARPGGFQSGRFVVISRLPTRQLTVPKGLPSDLVIRFQVSGPRGPFVVYAVRSGAGVIESTLSDPIGIDRLRSAALGERLPVVLVGDAGISDRSTAYRSLTLTFRDAMRAGRSASSTLGSFWMPLLLRVDHVFTSATWCATGGSTFSKCTAASPRGMWQSTNTSTS